MYHSEYKRDEELKSVPIMTVLGHILLSKWKAINQKDKRQNKKMKNY